MDYRSKSILWRLMQSGEFRSDFNDLSESHRWLGKLECSPKKAFGLFEQKL
jgi:hypothetical protein